MEKLPFSAFCNRFRLLVFFFMFVSTLQVSAQLVVDNCNTGPFTLFGNGALDNSAASGAIGGSRDLQISNGSGWMRQYSSGIIEVRPGGFPSSGNYDIGWGDNDVLGGNALNLNAADYDKIVVRYSQAPWSFGTMTLCFNKPGDPDYSCASLNFDNETSYGVVPISVPPYVWYDGLGRDHIFPLSNFSGLNPADIDGISIKISGGAPDTVIWIDYVQFSGFQDSDGDGIGDGSDNCPNTTNANQSDLDGDGIGDVCDDCQALAGIPAFNNEDCNCPPGYYTVTNGETGVITGCQLCPPGYYCPEGDVAIPCPAGSSASVSGSVVCVSCPAGSFSASIGSIVCTSCPAGTFNDLIGQVACTSCPPGSYSAVTGSSVCASCPAGTYNGNSGQTACLSCPAGSYSSETGSEVCASCPAGTYNGFSGQTACASCPPGSYSAVTGSLVCASCPAGTYNGNFGQVACESCPPGSYSSATGSIVCAECPAGTYNGNSGQTACLSCPPGSYSAVTGSEVCASCPAGTYNDLSGQTECTSCPPGSYSAVTGSIVCASCPAGTFSSNSGQVACENCPPGSYSATTGNTECTSCPAGTHNSLFGQTACENCPPGSFSSTTGSIECASCPVGTYNPTSGQTECQACPAGTSSGPGSTFCVEVDNADSDCDGIPDAEDNCPGGDDNGPCDATSFPGFNNIPASWRCGNNNNKVLMCHEGNTICVNPNAVAAHLGHGDFLGPCVSCVEARSNGTSNANEAFSMKLYPNPTSGKLSIDLHGLGDGDATLAVIDQMGRLVYEQTIPEYTDLVELDLSAQKIATGEYFVRVTSSEGVVVNKFVVSNK